MKKQLLLTATLLTLLFYACSNGKNDQVRTSSDSINQSSNNTLYNEELKKYNPNAIEPQAYVSALTLQAQGSSSADMKFFPNIITVDSGSTVKIGFINQATGPSMLHNWVLVRKGSLERIVQKGKEAGVFKNYIPEDEDILVAGRLVKPGEKIEIAFTAPPVDEYQFVCTYPGHSQKMQGIFIVK